MASCLFNLAEAAQLPPPILIKAESIEKTSTKTLLCNRSVIYWSNPSQSKVVRYRVFINGQDAKDYISYLANGFAGITLYDDTTQTVQLASEDSTGEIGPLSNPLTVTTPPCVAPKKYKIAILMATFADFQNAPMEDNLPWTLDVVKNRYSIFNTGMNTNFSIVDWLTRASYGKVSVSVDYFDEVVLKGSTSDYCKMVLPNYGAVLGYDCNTFQINQDAKEANGGADKFSKYHAVAVIAKGFGPTGISGITISAHNAHYLTYHPNGIPAYAALIHEFYHGLNLQHHAAFRVDTGCYYPKDLSNISKNCDWDRYGGSSIMGATIDLSPNADEVRRLGLLNKNQIVKVTPQSGSQSVSLEPLSYMNSGIKEIQIQGKGNYWFPNTYVFLEFRRSTNINTRAGMKNAILIHLRADLQNGSGSKDAMTYQIGYALSDDLPFVSFPEWGFSLRLDKMTDKRADVSVQYM